MESFLKKAQLYRNLSTSRRRILKYLSTKPEENTRHNTADRGGRRAKKGQLMRAETIIGGLGKK